MLGQIEGFDEGTTKRGKRSLGYRNQRAHRGKLQAADFLRSSASARYELLVYR